MIQGVVQRISISPVLRILHVTAEGPGSIPGQGTKISQAVQCNERKKKKRRVLLYVPSVSPVCFGLDLCLRS